MTVEEFDRTFKKGQNLTTQKWLDNDDDSILKYVGLDEEKLFVEWEDGSIHIMDVTEYEWILHPTQEKEQDLKDVFPYVEIEKHPDGRKSVYLSFGNKAEFEDDKEHLDDSEVITLQEAQERGLDLSMLNLKSE